MEYLSVLLTSSELHHPTRPVQFVLLLMDKSQFLTAIGKHHVYLVLVIVSALFCRNMHGVMAPAFHECDPINHVSLDQRHWQQYYGCLLCAQFQDHTPQVVTPPIDTVLG